MHPETDLSKILVVEDDPVLGQVLGRILTDAGYQVRHAPSVTEAWNLLQEWPPNLVLVDSSLRDGRGLEFGERFRTEHADVPVILLTPYPLNASAFPGWSSGHLLTKSIDLPEFRRAITAALAEPKSRLVPLAVSEQLEAMPITTNPPQKSLSPQPPQAAARPPRRLFESRLSKAAATVALGLLVLAGVAASRLPGKRAADAENGARQSTSKASLSVQVVAGHPHTLFVPLDVRKALGINKDGVDRIAVAKEPTWEQSLVMPGVTSLDPARTLRIRALFAPSPSSARVVEIGRIEDEQRPKNQPNTVFRELRPGDKVTKGNLLAVLYSVDVGNKKSDLVDAIIQLKLDSQVLARWEAKNAVVPQIDLDNQRKQVRNGINAINRAVATLRAWQISEEDIQAVRSEAERVKPEDAEKYLALRDKKSDVARWARVELRAPADGIIVEQNVSQAEAVVDNSINLFQIAQLDPGAQGPRLNVLANIPEDDLPLLQRLQRSSLEPLAWTVKMAGSPPIDGHIDYIGWQIDPFQHSAVIKGHIENRAGLIHGNQFATATVKVPAPKDVVELPVDAVVEDGQQSVVFVESDKARQQYTMRRVELTERFEHKVFVRSTPFAKGEEITGDEAELKLLPKEPLLPGTRVLESGVGELKAVLLDQESQAGTGSNE